MSEIIVGQVFSFKARFNNTGDIARKKHPYIVIYIDEDYIEFAQIDSLKDKGYIAMFKSNFTVFADNPLETVIDKDSYIQLDNTIRVENYCGITKFRRQEDVLSEKKLNDLLSAYKNYHDNNVIDENKQVFMDEDEIKSLNT